jgi:hypothetical protein
VFRFRKLTIPADEGGVTLLGDKPIVLIANEEIVVADQVSLMACTSNLSATAPGPGGFAGGSTAGAGRRWQW